MAKRILGIQIGEYRVICVEAKISGGIVAEKIATAPLPELSVVNGVITKPMEVVEVLEAIITKMEIVTDNTILNIPANLAQIKCIPTEENYLNITHDELEWELAQHFNEPMEEFTTSAFVLPITTVLIAAKTVPMEVRASIAEKVGLTVLSVDPEPIAIFNLFSTIEGSKPKRDIVIINIQVPYSHIVIFARGEFWNGGIFFTPPELFNLSEGKKTWREFTDDLVSTIKIAMRTYTKFNPAFEPGTIAIVGRILKEGVSSTISSQFNADIVDIPSLLKKKTKFKHKKAKISAEESAVALGLVAHGQTLIR
ncbi:hypothetical protein DRQ33_08605 [bacterium]|nr:MAG: hypothetical protein DRQ33_08605 [bacterium]